MSLKTTHERTALVGLLVCLSWSSLPKTCHAAVHIHTYDPGRDKTAQSIKDAYSKIDVINVIKLEETNLAAIDELELSLLENQAILRRNTEVFKILNDGNEIGKTFFPTNIDARMLQLLGKTVPSTDLTINGDALAADFDDLKIAALRFQTRLGIPPPQFNYRQLTIPAAEEWFEQHPPPANTPPAIYTDYSNVCNRIAVEVKPVSETTGTLAEALKGLIDGQNSVLTERLAAEASQRNYNRAVKEYDDTIGVAKASTTRIIQKALPQLDGYLREASQALEKLAKSGGPFGKFMAVTNELVAIDQVVAAAASTNATPVNASVKDPALRKAIALSSQLHGVLEQSANLEQAIRRPPLIDTLIKREVLLIEKDSLIRGIERRVARVKLLEAIWLSRVAEYDLLKDIKSLQGQMSTNALNLPMSEALSPRVSASDRKLLNLSLLEYAEVIRACDYQRTVAEFGLTHLTYQEANDASESAALMWNSLIANPINQLAEYHSSGIKPEQVADLIIKALGAGAIAWRLK